MTGQTQTQTRAQTQAKTQTQSQPQVQAASHTPAQPAGAAAVEVRRAETRGTTQIGWLDSRHSFSFGRYVDRSRPGFGNLRVINDDRVAPSGGFPEHPHRDMEILSWVVEGELRHQDSTGAGHTATRGTLQAMTAGSGVTHSEFNPSSTTPVRFLQIWIIPEREGLEPNYRQRDFSADINGALVPIATPTGERDSLTIHQDVRVLATRLDTQQSVAHTSAPGRTAYVQIVRGSAAVAGEQVAEGDAAIVRSAEAFDITANAAGVEALVFDLVE